MTYQDRETVRVYDAPSDDTHATPASNGAADPSAGDDTIDSLIDELEVIAVDGRRAPFTQSLLVRQDVLLDLIDRMRTAVPSDVRQAQRVLSQQQQMIDQAQSEAQRMLQERGLMQRLETERQQVIAAAQRDAEQIRHEADMYARDVLLRLQQRLDHIQGSVQHGIDTLSNEQNAK